MDRERNLPPRGSGCYLMSKKTSNSTLWREEQRNSQWKEMLMTQKGYTTVGIKAWYEKSKQEEDEKMKTTLGIRQLS